MRLRSLLWLAGLAGLAGACSGAPPAPPQKPPVPTPPIVAPNVPPPTTAPAADPVAPSPSMTRLANGLSVTLSAPPTSGEAQLQLGFSGGTDFATPGLAELAAETLVAIGDASQGRPSLRQAVSRCGGTVQVEVGPLTTWITVQVPANRWQEAHRAFTAAVTNPTMSRSQLERVRDEVTAQRIAAIWTNPDREASRAFLLGDTSTASYMAALLDRDVSEVALFQARLYRPDASIVSLRVPGDSTKVLAELATGLGTWQPAPGGAQSVPITTRRLQPGIYWLPAPPAAASRISVILPLPGLLRPEAADLFVLHNCITLDGLGGRLEQLQKTRGLAHVRWRSQFLQFAETAALVLTTETTPTEALALWQCVDAARRSLLELPPTAGELELARRRAVLTAELGESDVAAQLRNQASLLVHQLPPRGVQQRLLQLKTPGAMDARAMTKLYLEMPAAMVVFGGTIPAEATSVVTFELLPAGAYTRLAGTDPQVQVAAAMPWLDQATEAVGGKTLLQHVIGFEADSKLHAERSPNATERVSWRSSGTLQRTRELLDQKVETLITDGKGSEQAGAQKVGLTAREIALLGRELDRHPILLLAAHARGELQFRPVAQRNVGDRDLMILEAVGDRFDRLRIHVDTISHLIRIVEVWEASNDGTIVHIQDAWSDYRSSGGLRVPFRRITEQDDGQNRSEAVHTSWVPVQKER